MASGVVYDRTAVVECHRAAERQNARTHLPCPCRAMSRFTEEVLLHVGWFDYQKRFRTRWEPTEPRPAQEGDFPGGLTVLPYSPICSSTSSVQTDTIPVNGVRTLWTRVCISGSQCRSCMYDPCAVEGNPFHGRVVKDVWSIIGHRHESCGMCERGLSVLAACTPVWYRDRV